MSFASACARPSVQTRTLRQSLFKKIIFIFYSAYIFTYVSQIHIFIYISIYIYYIKVQGIFSAHIQHFHRAQWNIVQPFNSCHAFNAPFEVRNSLEGFCLEHKEKRMLLRSALDWRAVGGWRGVGALWIVLIKITSHRLASHSFRANQLCTRWGKESMPKERRRLIINFHHNLGLSQFEFARMRAARTRIEINFTGRLLVSGGPPRPNRCQEFTMFEFCACAQARITRLLRLAAI